MSQESPIEQARKPKDEAPFCWQPIAALNVIKKCPSVQDQPRAILIYVGLTIICNELPGQPRTFQASKSAIGGRVGLSKRTVAAGIYDLERAGVIKVQRTKFMAKENEINTYTLVAFKRGSAKSASPLVQTLHEGSCNEPLSNSARNLNSSLQELEIKGSATNGAASAEGGAPSCQEEKTKKPPRPVGLNIAW